MRGTTKCRALCVAASVGPPTRCSYHCVSIEYRWTAEPVTGEALGSLYGEGIPGDELVAETEWQETKRAGRFRANSVCATIIAECRLDRPQGLHLR